MCLDGESVMGGGSGVGTSVTGRGRGLGTRGIAAPCAGRGAPCEGCWGLGAPCCPSLGGPTASHADLEACAAALEASGGQVAAGDQKASGDQGEAGVLVAFDAHQASDVHQAYHVALEGYRSLVASVPGASQGPLASGQGPWKASHPLAFAQDHLDPSPSAEGKNII